MANPFKLPDGWGRSVVAGNEIITPPSAAPTADVSAEAGTQTPVPQIDLDDSAFDPFPEMRPDPNGWVGNYHKDDLEEQYEELKGNMNESEMDNFVLEDSKYKQNKDLPKDKTGNVDDRYIESTSFLASAVKYGRLQDMAKGGGLSNKEVDEKLDNALNKIKTQR